MGVAYISTDYLKHSGDFGIQSMPDQTSDRLRRTGFGQELHASARRGLTAHHLLIIATHADHLEIRISGPEQTCQLQTGHGIWHDHIGKQQANASAMLFPYLKPLPARAGSQHGVAVILQNSEREFTHRIIILDQQNCFRAAPRRVLTGRMVVTISRSDTSDGKSPSDSRPRSTRYGFRRCRKPSRGPSPCPFQHPWS
jgi:hypothetical protein